MTPEEQQMLQSGVGPAGMSNAQLGQQLMSMQPGPGAVSQAPPQASMAPTAPSVAAPAPTPQTPTEGMPLIGPGSLPPQQPHSFLSSLVGGQTPLGTASQGAAAQARESVAQPPQGATPEAKPDVSRGSSGGYGKPEGAAGGAGAQPAQGAVQPAGWTNTMEPGLRKQFAEGERNIESGIQSGAEAKAEGLGQQADLTEAGGKGIQAEHLQNLHDYQVQQTDAQNWIKSVQTRKQLWAEEKEDPKRLFKTMGAPKVIALAIGSGLSAFGAAMTHTQNDSIEMIQKAIDHDIEAQRQEHENKGKALEQEGNQWQERLRMLGDDRKANAALESEHWLAVDHQIQAAMARTDSQQALANGQVMRGQAQQKAAEAMSSVLKFHGPSMAGGASSAPSDVKPEEVVRGLDGRYVTIPDAAARQKAIGKIHASQDIDAALPRLKALAATSLLQRGPGWRKEMQEAGKVFTAPEIQEGAGKGGLGIFKAFTDPVSPTFGVFTPGIANAGQDIANKVRAEAHHALGTSAQHVVVPMAYQNPKTGERERRYSIVSEFKDEGTPGAAATPFKAGSTVGGAP